MIAIVENTPKIQDFKACEITIIITQFYTLLHRITVCANREALINKMEEFRSDVCWRNETHYFHWGFGGSHMWVKQRGNDRRLVFVKMLNEHI